MLPSSILEEGKRDESPGAPSRPTCKFHLAAMGDHRATDDGEAEADPARRTVARTLAPIKWHEGPFQVGCGEAQATVAHFHASPPALDACAACGPCLHAAVKPDPPRVAYIPLATGEAGLRVRVPLALIVRRLRPCADGARLQELRRLAGDGRNEILIFSGRQALGRRAAFDPLVERAHHVENIGSATTEAMPETRHHEQAGLAGARAQSGSGGFEIVDRVAGRDQRVFPSMIHQQLAAALGERP